MRHLIHDPTSSLHCTVAVHIIYVIAGYIQRCLLISEGGIFIFHTEVYSPAALLVHNVMDGSPDGWKQSADTHYKNSLNCNLL